MFQRSYRGGADQLGWLLEKLLTMTPQAMADSEDEINSGSRSGAGRDAADSEINDGADVSRLKQKNIRLSFRILTEKKKTWFYTEQSLEKLC